MIATTGRPHPMGATVDGNGVNFAVFSAHATRIEVCLFDEKGRETRVPLAHREGDVHFVHVEGVAAGQAYGLRAHGPYEPREGHRFNPNKLLLDPHARRITGHPVWDDALMGYQVGHPDGDLSFDTRDSAPFVPRCVVCDPLPAPANRPETPWERTVIYEAHVKGLTMLHPAIEAPGTFAALASDPVLDHLHKLGITAIELLPAQAFLNDRFLVERGLVNHWGYQTIGFLAPEPRYMSGNDVLEFRRAVDRFHERGIEVLMDVVYNHSGESDETGPTLSFRGLDNASYYRLAEDRRFYVNDTGTGNTLAADGEPVRRLVLDSLRYWHDVMGVDGFRFDLMTTLGRVGAKGFRPDAALLAAIRTDPSLAEAKLIAEPWDIGPGGYQLGHYPAPYREWNDRARDGIRRFWRGDASQVPELARRITGSAGEFDRDHRQATSSVNFVAAHDGFTLADTVAYVKRHNHANGEENRDGHGENFSSNAGVEGPSDDPAVNAARLRRRRNMAATLFLSQGVPMWLAGDEFGNGQGGNNNAYAQDNETGWTDWRRLDDPAERDFSAFVAELIALRRRHPVLSQARFLHAADRISDGAPDLVWWHEEGREMRLADWTNADRRLLAAVMRTASGTPSHAATRDVALVVLNAGGVVRFALPPGRWRRVLDTAEAEREPDGGSAVAVAADSVSLFLQEPE